MVSKVKKVNPTATKKAVKSSGSEWRIPGPDEFNEPSNNFFDYYTLIHGTAGVGKSSLIASIPGSVIFQFEPARRNIKARQIDFKVSTVAEMERGSVNGWKKFTTLLEQVEDDATVKVIGIDNINEAYKACENDYLLQNGMESVPKKDYGASRGEINREYERVLNNLKFNSRLGVI
ncbi:MAG: AAA family ATPase, partial [bacterium]